MALSDCDGCWETPCVCGEPETNEDYQYEDERIDTNFVGESSELQNN